MHGWTQFVSWCIYNSSFAFLCELTPKAKWRIVQWQFIFCNQETPHSSFNVAKLHKLKESWRKRTTTLSLSASLSLFDHGYDKAGNRKFWFLSWCWFQWENVHIFYKLIIVLCGLLWYSVYNNRVCIINPLFSYIMWMQM